MALIATLAALMSDCAWALVSLPVFWNALTWLMKAFNWLTAAVLLGGVALRLAVALLSLTIRALPLPLLRVPAVTSTLTWLPMDAICCWALTAVTVRTTSLPVPPT